MDRGPEISMVAIKPKGRMLMSRGKMESMMLAMMAWNQKPFSCCRA